MHPDLRRLRYSNTVSLTIRPAIPAKLVLLAADSDAPGTEDSMGTTKEEIQVSDTHIFASSDTPVEKLPGKRPCGACKSDNTICNP
ncbi:MAG: hypothetical protein JXB88_05695 [Spirochaetales bacterium]|nr:hypothetical protein [Spirochaetales bacterium]